MVIKTFNKLSKMCLLIKRGKFIKDSVVLGATGGFLGSVAMALSNLLIYKAGKTEILYGHIGGSIFMRPFKTNRRKNYILGQIFHLVTGSSAGLLMLQIYKLFGTDFSLLKGAMMGMFTWQGLFNVGQRLKIYTANPHLTKTGYSAIWNNFVYGVVTASSIKWLAHPFVFSSSKPQANQQNKIGYANKQMDQEPESENINEYSWVH